MHLAWITRKWQIAKNSFLFIPGIIIFTVIFLAFVLSWIDTNVELSSVARNNPILTNFSSSGAQGILTTIATAFMTAMSIAFPMTVVAVQLTSSQYSSRVLRTFMKDRITQIFLGLLVSIFIYSLLILRTIHVGNMSNNNSVPQLSIYFAILFALVNAILLIYYIYHITQKIQVTEIIKAIHKDLIQDIPTLFPERIGKGYKDPTDTKNIRKKLHSTQYTQKIKAQETGFLRSVDSSSLIQQRNSDIQWIVIRPCIGDFIKAEELLIEIGSNNQLSDEALKKIRDTIEIGTKRSEYNDLLFGINQFNDLALKVFSSGDTTTVGYCLEYLGDVLIRLADKQLPDNSRIIKDAPTLFLFSRPSWNDYVDQAFSRIRRKITKDPHLTSLFLEIVSNVAIHTPIQERRKSIYQQVTAVKKAIKITSYVKNDKELLLNKIIQTENIFDRIR